MPKTVTAETAATPRAFDCVDTGCERDDNMIEEDSLLFNTWPVAQRVCALTKITVCRRMKTFCMPTINNTRLCCVQVTSLIHRRH